jgi:hypothetical protein
MEILALVALTQVGALGISAIGPKQTPANALRMSAFGGKADITIAACPLLRSLLGAKQTWAFCIANVR